LLGEQVKNRTVLCLLGRALAHMASIMPNKHR